MFGHGTISKVAEHLTLKTAKKTLQMGSNKRSEKGVPLSFRGSSKLEMVSND